MEVSGTSIISQSIEIEKKDKLILDSIFLLMSDLLTLFAKKQEIIAAEIESATTGTESTNNYNPDNGADTGDAIDGAETGEIPHGLTETNDSDKYCSVQDDNCKIPDSIEFNAIFQIFLDLVDKKMKDLDNTPIAESQGTIADDRKLRPSNKGTIVLEPEKEIKKATEVPIERPTVDIEGLASPLHEEVDFDSGNSKQCPSIDRGEGKLLPYAIINGECAYTDIISK